MPAVFKTKIAINQYNWLFFAALHNAMPFQTASQAIIGMIKSGINATFQFVKLDNCSIIIMFYI